MVFLCNGGHYKFYKPVGDWISAPRPNVVAMAIRVGPTTFCMVPLNRPSSKTPNRCKHLRSICRTRRLIGDFSPNFGESILGTRGPKSKIEEQRFVEGVMENYWSKNGSIPPRNKTEAIWFFFQNSPNFVFMARNAKSKNNVLYSATCRTDGPKMAQSIEKQKKKQFEWAWQTNIRTDRVNCWQ